MKALRFALLLLAAAMLFGGSASAGTYGTADEAKAMALRAADYLKAQGPEEAFAAFNEAPEWRDGDLNVFVVDDTGTWVVSGARPDLVGVNEMNVTDADGKPFIQEIVAIEDEGWVEYKFTSPADGEIHGKTSYIVRVGNNLVGVGAYKY